MRLSSPVFIVIATVGLLNLVHADQDICDVFYGGHHCFVALLDQAVNHGHGEEACEGIGGRLADLHSYDEMLAIRDHLRERMDGGVFRLDLRTGMKYEHETLYNADGSETQAQLRWAETWPRTLHGWSDVILTIVKDWGVSQFRSPEWLSNKPPSNIYASLCEIPM